MGLTLVSYKTCSDEELLPAIENGNTPAFDELYGRYGQKIFGYFYRMLWKNKELAEDFTQELFLKLIKNAATFKTDHSFSTWLYSIANNMCKNEYRKQGVRIQHQQQKITVVSAEPVSPDMRRFKEAVHNCTNDLPEDKKTLYMLRFHENLSVPDISRILNLPEGTIKSRIFYLLKEMKTKLKAFETLTTYP
ncbi:MAG TPA: sigma-70 family RNA polymerase sigma factor [Ferruginibacter sp.]|nr:sigma-70 family RNA polymerase sigma factor [Ferruginibacter sp.]